MPSKGVQVYGYIAVPGCAIEFSVPKSTILRNALNTWSNDHLEIDYKNLGKLFNYTGRFTFRATQDGAQLTSQWVDVNTLTGNLENGTMKTMSNTPSIIVNDVIITYGFYDAGLGQVGLPNSHQCYVTITLNYSNWMAAVAPVGSPQEKRPFTRMVLPCAHDVGMNSMQTSESILQKAGTNAVKTMLGGEKGFTKLDQTPTD